MQHPIRQSPHLIYGQVFKIHPVPQFQVEQDPQPEIVIRFSTEMFIQQRLYCGAVEYTGLDKTRLSEKIP